MNRFDLVRWLSLALAVCALGCSKGSDKWTEDRPQVYPAGGVVQHNGAPLEGATVVFRSETEQKAAYGTTDAEGKFKLTTFDDGDGAVAGKHQVRITKIETKEAPPAADPEGPVMPPEEISLLPAKYGDFKSSGLTAEVVADGENQFEFKLQD
ncbi:MAG: carboxypeptidase regulatory-like domain-containing protein [Rhodopirellula sp.]|nr:carboxypeptidase regulatory-like domain-containing protein [Rhodopirellula sp.]